MFNRAALCNTVGLWLENIYLVRVCAVVQSDYSACCLIVSTTSAVSVFYLTLENADICNSSCRNHYLILVETADTVSVCTRERRPRSTS